MIPVVTNPLASPLPATAAGIILASTSPYRKALLERLGLPFRVVSPGIDEIPLTGETPRAVATRLAREKAAAVAARHPEALVIGSDQTASLDDRNIIGKPMTHARAVEQLRAASGRVTKFHTALSVLRQADGFVHECVIDTRVTMRALSDAMIESYLAREPAYDCAGSAKIEGLGIALVERLEGEDPTALIGLPMIALTRALEKGGFAVL
jgi:septum formation protein